MDKKELTPYNFLEHPDATLYFKKIDYALKNGVHIQQWKEQYYWFKFINSNEESLKLYYQKYFDLKLENGGDGNDKYYYIDFMTDLKGSIPTRNKKQLPNEQVIIGILIYKIIFIDGYLEISTVSQLQKTIHNEYEDLKDGLCKIITNTKGSHYTQKDYDKLNDTITSACKSFDRIGWIELSEDTLHTLPSFHRLRQIYGEYIEKIDDIIHNPTQR